MNLNKLLAASWLSLGIVLIAPVVAVAGDDKVEAAGEEEPKTIAEVTEDSDRLDGLFTLFRDRTTGDVHMLIGADQLDREFIYFAKAANGVVEAGYFRGAYLGSRVVTLRRHFDRIEIVEENTAYYFDPDNALAKAADANISDGTLTVEKIVAEDTATGQMLIKANEVFLTEALLQIKPTPDPDADPKTTFALGKLDGEKSKILHLRSYPRNTDLEVEYVYNNPAPLVSGSPDVTDPRNVSIRVMHSLIAMPENSYQPRRDDPRVGYFSSRKTDLTSFSPTPYRDFIARWQLEKKDPAAAVSDPVEPITWWIENTTPVEYRELIRSAALGWNEAFEKAGFSNALVVKIQPDDADWDAGDIRYNVLRWTSSPNPPFGGYGPSFVNPRTGQILGADIMLEYSFLNRYLYARYLLANGAELAGEPALALAGSHAGRHAGQFCSLADGLKTNNLFAATAARVAGFDDEYSEQLIHDTIHYLILHELGHTLGLNHNMRATQLLTPEQAFDPEAVDTLGLAGSVMDYPAVNFAPRGKTQTLFYAVRPGAYDDWAIEYGYSAGLSDPQAEQARLAAIAARSTEPALAFGNDADDMRSPGKAIDPRVNIYDMSSDAIGYASGRMTLLQTTITEMADRMPEDGASYQEIHDGLVVLLREWGRSAAVVSRYVGGVYLDRGMAGQPGAGAPYTPVDAATQQRAVAVLETQLFAPDALTIPGAVLRHAAQQRRGFDFYGKTEDPKIHDAWLALQKRTLDHLLHPAVLKRVTDTRLYGNEYALSELFTDLNDAVFAADARGDVNTFRQNLQVEYVKRLAAMVRGPSSGEYDHASQSMSVHSLKRIDALLGKKRRVNLETEAHVQNLRLIIERALSAEA